MSLREAANVAHPPKRCRLGGILEQLDEDDSAVFAEWVDEGRSVTWIAHVLKNAGINIHRDTIRIHFRGLCQCQDGPFYGAQPWEG